MSATHLHLIVNHVPVLGPAFGLLLLALGWVKKSEDLKRASLLLFIVAALFALPAYLTGEPAEKGALGLPGVSALFTEKHENAAQLALGATLGLGGLAMAALVLFRDGTPVPRWFLLLVLTATLAATGLMFWTAALGGQVRHTEIRAGPPPEDS